MVSIAKSNSKLSKLKKFLKILFVVLILIAILRPDISLPWCVSPLVETSTESRNADYIIVLMGSPTNRPAAAAKAVINGFAPKLLMADCETNALEEANIMPRESLVSKTLAERQGLLSNQIEIISSAKRVTSTVDEALAFRDYFKSQQIKPKRIIIATSWYHSSRAKWIFEKALFDMPIQIDSIAIAEPKFDSTNWWNSEFGMIVVFEEYIKWMRYLVKYSGRDITATTN